MKQMIAVNGCIFVRLGIYVKCDPGIEFCDLLAMGVFNVDLA
jgi:hypothetical protein